MDFSLLYIFRFYSETNLELLQTVNGDMATGR
jgi:hypothetical protein